MIQQEENILIMVVEELRFVMNGRMTAVFSIDGLEIMGIKKVFGWIGLTIMEIIVQRIVDGLHQKKTSAIDEIQERLHIKVRLKHYQSGLMN